MSDNTNVSTKTRNRISLENTIEYMTRGVTTDLPSIMEDQLNNIIDGIDSISDKRRIDREYQNSTDENKVVSINNKKESIMGPALEEDISGEIDTILDANKKFYTLLRDIEMMPILVTQIFRVLNFLVNEILSPDIRGEGNFKYVLTKSNPDLLKEAKRVRADMGLDRLVHNIISDRLRVGRVFYLVRDYNETFDQVMQTLNKTGVLNESHTFSDILNETTMLPEHIKGSIGTINESITVNHFTGKDYIDINVNKDDSIDLDIDIEYSSRYQGLNDIKNVLSESYYSIDLFDQENNDELAFMNENIFINKDGETILNESAIKNIDDEKKEKIKAILGGGIKSVNRCSIEKLDPAKVLILRASGHIVGYFYMKDKEKNSPMDDIIRSRLIKSKATGDLTNAYKEAERKIVDSIADKLIAGAKKNLKINNIEDVDIIHDFITHSGILDGGKRLIFYRKDEVFDLSRAEGSLLTKAIYPTKQYATLRANNLTTKVLKGRDRNIIRINTGASNVEGKYIDYAIEAFASPENRLGAFQAPFNKVINPLHSATDIIIPTEDGAPDLFAIDVLEGQRVDQDDETLKELLGSIMNAIGVDSAIVDSVNNNIDFARTLSMISKQVSNMCRGEQDEVSPELIKMLKRIYDICIPKHKELTLEEGITISLNKSLSLELELSQNELNNAINYAEALANIHPILANLEDGDIMRSLFIYTVVKKWVNMDLDSVINLYDELEKDETIIELKKRVIEAKRKAIEERQTQNITPETTEPNLDNTDDLQDFDDDDM